MAKIEQRSMTRSVNGKVIREAKDEESMVGKYYWWKQKEDGQEAELANQITSTIRFIQRHQDSRVTQLVASTRLYGASSAFNLVGPSIMRGSSMNVSPTSSRLSFNLCSSVVDTVTATEAKNKIVPTFITSGGVWGMQRKAEMLSKFIEGKFYEQKVQTKRVYQCRDAGIWGDGLLYIYRDINDRAAVKRTLPHEWLVDMVEAAMEGGPRQIHRVYIEDRSVLCEEYPEYAKEIMEAAPTSYQEIGGYGTAGDLVTVALSIHLPSSKKATDGLKVVTLLDSAKVLEKVDWTKEYFPISKLPYCLRPVGFWGQGACERLMNLQGEINRTMITIQKSHWLFAGTKIYLPIGSKIVSQHINNELGSIIHGNQPPSYLSPPMIQEKMYEWVETLKQDGYQQEGVSQLSASNLKPQGINSGAALRTYDTISEDRQLFFSQQCEEATLETARQLIEIVKEVFKEKGHYKVQFPNTNFVEQIDWADVNLEMDEYWLKAFPTSELPEEPSAKLETVQEYMQAGLISPRAGRRLLAMPDVEMSDKLANAAEELICKSIEGILYDKERVRPDGEWDLQLAKTMSLQYMNYAKLNDCPKDRIEMLREFMAFIDDEMGLTNPPPPPPPMITGQSQTVTPMANPQPTPQTNLIPNTAAAA